MPPTSDAAAKAAPTKSVRRSLGFASVGKAFADVMNKDSKDSKDSDKASKRTSRRSSAVALAATASRPSTEGASPSPGAKAVGTPEPKTITRRRTSGTGPSKSEGLASPPTGVVTRSSSLRPRPAGTGLPKYRPKSFMQDNVPKKGSSPSSIRAKATSKTKASDKDSTSDETDDTSAKVSPLPQVATYKVELVQSPHITPPSTPTRKKPSTPSRSSPTRASIRPGKAPSAAPSSSSSSTSGAVPRTPKNQSARISHKKTSSNPSPSPSRSFNDSPLARHGKSAANMSHISEGNSDDESEEEDVAMLLAPVASPGAPTPAMPRYASRRRLAPHTPSRPLLPTRAHLSYLSPLPPDDEVSASRRADFEPSPLGAPRGSILSWEQFANEAAKSLGEDEIQNMLEIPAPFRSGAASPTPSMLHDIPESPCLSALSSPGGYASISHVLLPQVTPSPAIHNRRVSRGPFEVPEADGATATLLKLQLESAEHTAKERLMQLQTLEEENHHLKDARRRDAELLAAQVGSMEEELRSRLEARERTEAEQATYITALEKQLSEAISARDRLAGVSAHVQSQVKKLGGDTLKVDCVASAEAAALQWRSVHDLAEAELDVIASDQNVLTLLLAELDLKKKELMA